jgi:hypothetical protein
MLVGRWVGERREQGEALAKCLRAGLSKSRSLRLTAILLPVRWPENTRCLDDPPHPWLDLGRLFRFHWCIDWKPFLFVNDLLFPHFNPVIPQKTVSESDSPIIEFG